MDQRSLPLFPIPISLYNVGDTKHNLNTQLTKDILEENLRDPVGQTRSNMGGWHSKAKLESFYSSFEDLRGIIEEQANIYCRLHGFADGLICRRLWANVNESGNSNLAHAHGNGALTGVYYPVEKIEDNGHSYFNYDSRACLKPGTWDGKEGGSLVFYDPSYGLKSNLIKDPSKPSPYTFDTYYTYPVSGLLILFPSYIIHAVTPFTDSNKRLSISFVCNYGKT